MASDTLTGTRSNSSSGRFLWGVATSAFQLEGAPGADWTAWDRTLDERPELTNHYTLYKDDLALLRDLGVNAYRFSLEWSRIQPREDAWDEKAIDHYRDVVAILRSYDIEPMVTLHHFTHPVWFTEKYPWHRDQSVEYFLRYAEKVLSSIEGVRHWITFNEPYVLILGGYFEGCTPPAIRDISLGVAALTNILRAHADTYDLIHSVCPGAEVSVAHNMAALAPWKSWNPMDKLLARIAGHFYNHSLLDAFKSGLLRLDFPFQEKLDIPVPIRGKLDFFGVNYYTRIHMRFNPFKKMGAEMRHLDIEGRGLTDMGWEIHPKGLERVLRTASRLDVPLIITENGIATRDSQKKISFMREHVDVVERCIRSGMDIRGYFYWSLMDNYEWLQGLDAHFGLYGVDFDTLRRTPTNAAAYYSYIIKSRNFR